MAASHSKLLHVHPDKVRPNPENPRLIFREDDMRALRESIKNVGIQVALTVYQEGTHYILLDGERRWRAARKLNLKEIPIIVQPKPEPLENLLKMFNIHNVRVEWDVIAIALKLGDVRKLLQEKGRSAEIKDIAELTGLSKPMVRNCLELLELPKKYQDMLFEEAKKPKHEQRITPDLFIEISKSQRVVQSFAPEVFEDVTPRQYVDRMVDKYKAGVVDSVVAFRDISKIARAERAGASREALVPILKDLVVDKSYTIKEAFEDSAKDLYEHRDLASRAESVIERLNSLKKGKIPKEMVDVLRRLRTRIDELIGS